MKNLFLKKIVTASLLVSATSLLADVVNLDNLLSDIIQLKPGAKAIPLPVADKSDPAKFTGNLYTFTPTEGPAKDLPIYFYILRSTAMKGYDVFKGQDVVIDGITLNILAPGTYNPDTNKWTDGVFDKYVKTKKGIPAKFAEYSAASSKTTPGNIYTALTYKIDAPAIDKATNELKGTLTPEGTFVLADNREGGPLPVCFGCYMVQPNVLAVS